jgi:hypothetical protein
MVTSHTDRTSPVARGKWILDNLLGAPPPLPPANVPPLKDNERTGRERVLSQREKIEAHRASPACASCHKIMDPIELALENFDAVGAYRERDGQSLSSSGTPIDASGQLMDGTRIDGVVALRKALVKDPDVFVGALTKAADLRDGPRRVLTCRPCARSCAMPAANYSFASLVSGIVSSVQMRMKTAESTSLRKRAPRPDGNQRFVNQQTVVRSQSAKEPPVMFITRKSLSSSHSPRNGCHRCPAAGYHGAGLTYTAKTANPVPFRHGLRRPGRAAEPLAACHGRRELRDEPYPEAAREVPRS